MNRVARHHHYVPQAYLRAFTENGAKKSKFTVYDLRTGARFETTPRNVAGERDFNRISVPGYAPDAIETEMAKFERLVPNAVRRIEETNQFQDEEKIIILNLIALLAVRHPDRREYMRTFHAKLANIVMGMTLHSKVRFEGIISQMRVQGGSVENDISYEELKEFYERGEYTIEVATERHLSIENTMHEALLPLLIARKWMLYRADPAVGHFITCDSPVSLTWKKPEKAPPLYSSPGFGMLDTEIVFPLTKGLVLVGNFDGVSGYQVAQDLLIAIVNARIATQSRRQIYSPKRHFLAVDSDLNIINGEEYFSDRDKKA